MSTYSDFQNQNSSEKLVLAKVNASKRLIGFEVHASSVYRLTNFDFNKILSVEDSGAGLTEVFGLSEVVPGSFYNDRTNKILYLETSGSTNPNGEFIAMSFTNFFSNGPVQAANDLSTGFEVNWLPIIQKTSGFGVTLDNEDQIGFALEGAGSITFVMDREYFDSRFEGFIWENQDVEIYSWTRTLDISEAKIIYKGAVNSKTFGNVVRFTLKDKIEQLRRPFPLSDLSTVSGARIPDGLNTAKKRFVYGRLNGFLPTNIDQNLEGGYELSGTVAVTGGSSTITGTGTLFKTWFSPEDTILINGIEFVIESVTSDTVMDATETFSFNASGVTPFIDPDQPKSFINREWIVAGHACHQPPLTITDSLTSNRFFISSTDDVEVGDQLSIGTGSSAEVVTVSQVLGGGLIKTTEALLAAPATGTAVIRPCVQNLRLNNTKLQYGRDYTVSVSSTETKITLETDAEKNINPIRTLNGTVDFTLSSPTVTGVGTAFESQLRPGQHVRAKGQVAFFQILSIESDTSLTLIEDSTYTDTGGLV